MSGWRGHPRKIRFTNTTNISLGLAWGRRAHNKEIKEKKKGDKVRYIRRMVFSFSKKKTEGINL